MLVVAGSHTSIIIIITILFVLKVHQTHYNIPQKISKITSNEEEERNYWIKRNKSASKNTQQKICLKATTHTQADQHEYTECLKSIHILLASA